MKTCKVCGEEKEDKNFPVCRRRNDIEYRVKTCGSCAYKIKKENGKVIAYYKTHPEKWREYQKEYARVNYYDYYKKERKKENE